MKGLRTFLFFITPIAAIIRFLTVGSCPFKAASSFKSLTGFESLEYMVGNELELEVTGAFVSVDIDGENEQPLATTISVVFCIVPNDGIFKLETFELFPNVDSVLSSAGEMDDAIGDNTDEENDVFEKLFSPPLTRDKSAIGTFADLAVVAFPWSVS